MIWGAGAWPSSVKPVGEHPHVLMGPALGAAAESLPGHPCVQSLEVKQSSEQWHVVRWWELGVGKQWESPAVSPECLQNIVGPAALGIPLAAVVTRPFVFYWEKEVSEGRICFFIAKGIRFASDSQAINLWTKCGWGDGMYPYLHLLRSIKV